jgi:hypothetical protein
MMSHLVRQALLFPFKHAIVSILLIFPFESSRPTGSNVNASQDGAGQGLRYTIQNESHFWYFLCHSLEKCADVEISMI